MFISGLEMADGRWLWKHSFSGDYSVKSGYNLAYRWRMSRASGEGEGSDWELKEIIWRRLWTAKVPERMKILSWRLYHNALPVFSNLVRRGVGVNQACMLCGYKVETTTHLFLDCWWTRSIWDAIGPALNAPPDSTAVSDWLWSILKEGNMETIRTVLMGVHLIWYNRNLVTHGKRGWNASWCALKVSSMVSQLDRKRLTGFSSVSIGIDLDDSGWQVFCDGSWSWKERNGGWAAILYCNNVIVECRTGFAGGGIIGLQTELNAIILGLQLAEENGCTSCVVHSDCAEAVWTFQSGHCNDRLNPRVVSLGMNILKMHQGWTLKHILRDQNHLADSLAKRARADGWEWHSKVAIPRCVDFRANV